jgi:putative ABC transport system permease protein
LTIGLILSLLAREVFISFRIFDFPDITADGSSTLGAVGAAALIVKGTNPLVAGAGGFAAGFVAGSVTGVLAAKFKINGLLAGILVMTGLYFVNLHIMGRSNVPLFSSTTLSTYSQSLGVKFLGGQAPLNILGWEVTVLDASTFVLVFLSIALVGGVLCWFFQTNLGTAMRATGDNSQMIRALGVSDENMVILGLAVSNGLIGLAGVFLAPCQGFAHVQRGIGMVV